MSREAFTIAYDGPALRDGVMDVRDLAPALLALGQLMDAANANLNGQDSHVKLEVRATEHGSFQIALELTQKWGEHLLEFLASPDVSGATNLLNWVLGFGGAKSLLWLIKKLRGRSPEKIERLSADTMRLTFDGKEFDVPLRLLKLYTDVSVRTAVQRLIEEPLRKEGIDTFRVGHGGTESLVITKSEAADFLKPPVFDQILIEEVRRYAFSIISLAFKEDNKWRLFDGSNQINVTIEDAEFLDKMNRNLVSFAKGDILICDVKLTQKKTEEGLRTEYVVEKVVEHQPAARQLPML